MSNDNLDRQVGPRELSEESRSAEMIGITPPPDYVPPIMAFDKSQPAEDGDA